MKELNFGDFIYHLDNHTTKEAMTKQAQNFLNLCQMENNSISSIKRALGMITRSVKQELMEHYSVNDDDALAAKIALK